MVLGTAPHLGGFQHLEQRRAGVPVEAIATVDDHVALERRQRDRVDAREAEVLREFGERGDDVAEGLRVVVDEVHLVHGEHEMRDAQQARDVRVAARLLQQALARVDEHDREVGRRGARHHVPRVLLVARGVGDDELARRRGEVAVRDVDRDALLALGHQAVGQQREVDGALAASLAGALDGRELVLEDRFRVVQQAPDERALAVVDAAGRGKAQQAGVDRRELFDGGHQK